MSELNWKAALSERSADERRIKQIFATSILDFSMISVNVALVSIEVNKPTEEKTTKTKNYMSAKLCSLKCEKCAKHTPKIAWKW